MPKNPLETSLHSIVAAPDQSIRNTPQKRRREQATKPIHPVAIASLRKGEPENQRRHPTPKLTSLKAEIVGICSIEYLRQARSQQTLSHEEKFWKPRPDPGSPPMETLRTLKNPHARTNQRRSLNPDSNPGFAIDMKNMKEMPSMIPRGLERHKWRYLDRKSPRLVASPSRSRTRPAGDQKRERQSR